MARRREAGFQTQREDSGTGTWTNGSCSWMFTRVSTATRRRFWRLVCMCYVITAGSKVLFGVAIGEPKTPLANLESQGTTSSEMPSLSLSLSFSSTLFLLAALLINPKCVIGIHSQSHQRASQDLSKPHFLPEYCTSTGGEPPFFSDDMPLPQNSGGRARYP